MQNVSFSKMIHHLYLSCRTKTNHPEYITKIENQLCLLRKIEPLKAAKQTWKSASESAMKIFFSGRNNFVQLYTEVSRHLRIAVSAFDRFMPTSDAKQRKSNSRHHLPFWWDKC